MTPAPTETDSELFASQSQDALEETCHAQKAT